MTVKIQLTPEWIGENVLFEKFEDAQANLSRDFPGFIVSKNDDGSGYIFNAKGHQLCKMTSHGIEFKS